MPTTVRQSLAQKGWSQEDIAKAENIIFSKEKQMKHYGYVHKVNPLIYWLGLLLAIIGNMIISVFLVPFLLVMTDVQLYLVIGLMGLVFGAMFNFLLRDIEHVDYQHHVMAGVFIPVLAVITIFVLVNISNTFAAVMNIPIQHSVLVLSILYVGTFTAPYAMYKIKDLRSQKRPLPKKADLSKEEPPEQEVQLSQEEAWKVYHHRKAMEKDQIQNNLKNKFGKYL